jgi:hypothetical protein
LWVLSGLKSGLESSGEKKNKRKKIKKRAGIIFRGDGKYVLCPF